MTTRTTGSQTAKLNAEVRDERKAIKARFAREAYQERQNLTRLAKKKDGICIYCDQPAEDGKISCKEHLDKSVAHSTAYKRRCVEKGQCVSCTAKATRGQRCLQHWLYLMYKSDAHYPAYKPTTPTIRQLQRYAAWRIKHHQKKMAELKPFCKPKDLWPTKTELRRIKT